MFLRAGNKGVDLVPYTGVSYSNTHFRSIPGYAWFYCNEIGSKSGINRQIKFVDISNPKQCSTLI